jgi:hypothetical protein
MANANWSNPQLTSTYTNFLAEVKNRDEDLALQFDGTTSSNILTNTIRWDSTASRWKKWSGTAWGELAATYALTGLSTTGAASIGTTLGVTGAITGSSTITGTALIPSGSSIPANGIYMPSANSIAIATNSFQRLAIDYFGAVTIPGTLSVTLAVSGYKFTSETGIQVGNGSVYKPGIYSPATDQIAIATAGIARVLVNENGNIGVGVTPSNWGVFGSWKALEFSTGNAVGTSGSQIFLSNNAYNSGSGGGWLYKSSAAAGLYQCNAGVHSWHNAPSGTAGAAITFTQAMTLDAGNLGVGVTPSAWSIGRAIELASGALWSYNSTIQDLCHNTYNNGSYIYKNTAGASVYRQSGSSHVWFNAPSGTAGAVVTFTQAMTLDGNGRLIVGKTSTNFATTGIELGANLNSGGWTCFSTSTAATSSDGNIACNQATSGAWVVKVHTGGTEIGGVRLNGLTGTSFATTSDYRLKENIVSSANAINRLQQLSVYRFNFIVEPEKTVDGFIAHEVATVVPEAISGDKDAVNEDGAIQPQCIDQSKLVPLLTAALQEAIARIETLEAQVATLQAS